MRTPMFIAALLLAVLGGCSLFRPASTASGPAEAGASAPKVSLADEQRRLADLFRGTPVVFAMQADGSLRVTVPLHFSFDRGRYAVKPPLAAVLDRIVKSQRAEATRLVVAAPADPRSKGLRLATERATSARDYMVGRGIDATRFSVAALGSGDNVIVVVTDVAAQ